MERVGWSKENRIEKRTSLFQEDHQSKGPFQNPFGLNPTNNETPTVNANVPTPKAPMVESCPKGCQRKKFAVMKLEKNFICCVNSQNDEEVDRHACTPLSYRGVDKQLNRGGVSKQPGGAGWHGGFGGLGTGKVSRSEERGMKRGGQDGGEQV